MTENDAHFDYPKRVRFHCTRCTLCCGDTKAKDRHILMLEREAKRISQRVSKPVEAFACRISGREPYVFEMQKIKEGRCVFLAGNICNIYTSRPLICRYYPFQLKTLENGLHAFYSTKECPGVGAGRLLRKDYFETLYRKAQQELKDEDRSAVERTRR